MSRGPGIRQRQILDRIAAGKVVVLTAPEHTRAEQNAIRRAAKRLEQSGQVQITSIQIGGVARLVAGAIDTPVPAPFRVLGLDGKTYLRPER